MWRSWALFLADFSFGIEFALFNMLVEPALRSWVHCETRMPTGDAGLFSGSATCGDRKFVIQRAARLSGWLGAMEGGISLLCMPLMGAFGDYYGRLPVLWVCITGHVFALVVFSSSRGSIPIIVFSYFVRGCTGAFFATFKAILADLGGNRSLAYTVKALFAFGGHGFGWLMALIILRRNLVDYSVVWWMCMAICAAGVAFSTQISESVHKKPKVGEFSLTFLREPFLFVMRERFMTRWCAAKFFIILGVSVAFILKSFVLSAFGWRQGRFEALMGIAGAIGAASTCCAPMLIRMFSTQVVVCRTALLAAIATTCLVFAPAGPIFCLLPALAKASGSCGYTASTTLLADKYVEDQGKSGATALAVGHVASSLGHLLYASLFNAKATSFIAQARPFMVAAPLTWIGYAFMLASMSVGKQPSPASAKDLELL